MKSILFSLLATVVVFSQANAQIESGRFRINPDLTFTSIEGSTSAELNLLLGYAVIPHLEIGGEVNVTKVEDVDAFGGIQAAAIYHILPDLKVVPGVGAAFGTTLGMGENSLVSDVFFNLDGFVTEKWSFNLRAGYERWDNDYVDIDGFLLHFGVSTFIGGE